jgi:hypothetical protein
MDVKTKNHHDLREPEDTLPHCLGVYNERDPREEKGLMWTHREVQATESSGSDRHSNQGSPLSGKDRTSLHRALQKQSLRHANNLSYSGGRDGGIIVQSQPAQIV